MESEHRSAKTKSGTTAKIGGSRQKLSSYIHIPRSLKKWSRAQDRRRNEISEGGGEEPREGLQTNRIFAPGPFCDAGMMQTARQPMGTAPGTVDLKKKGGVPVARQSVTGWNQNQARRLRGFCEGCLRVLGGWHRERGVSRRAERREGQEKKKKNKVCGF